MNIPIKTIDTDGVLPKKKDAEYPDTDGWDNKGDIADAMSAYGDNCGFNACVTHNETLTLDMDAEKMAEMMNDCVCDKNRPSGQGMEEFLNYTASYLIQNPTWLKIGKAK